MDVLVADAKVIKRRAPNGLLQQACFAPKVDPSFVTSPPSQNAAKASPFSIQPGS